MRYNKKLYLVFSVHNNVNHFFTYHLFQSSTNKSYLYVIYWNMTFCK